IVSGSAGRAGAAGCGATAPAAAASRPARKPASQARWLALAGPTTRLRRSISSSANGAVFGIGDISTLISWRRLGAVVCRASDRCRIQMVDDGKDHEQHHADAEAPADQFFLDRQKRFDFRLAKLLTDIHL